MKWKSLIVLFNLEQLKSSKLLIEHGANVNARDSHGNTPLILAAKLSMLKIHKVAKGKLYNIFFYSVRSNQYDGNFD